MWDLLGAINNVFADIFLVIFPDPRFSKSNNFGLEALTGPGGSMTLGRSKSSFMLFLTEVNVSYQKFFTGSKNTVPSRSYQI